MGSYDFYTLVTCLVILALQIHNPFQDRTCREPAPRPPEPTSAGAVPPTRRPREASAVASSPGLSTDALLRELDSLQDKAKEQQETLAAAGRMPPPSPILQHLKETEAAMPQVQVPPRAAAMPQQVPQAQVPPGLSPSTPAPQGGGFLVRRREELGQVLQAQMPRGLGVVLGVGRGEFAVRLLRDWTSSHGLYLVDPFIHQWRGYDDPANLQDNDHQLIFEDLRNRLEPFEGRYVLVRDFSHSFAEVYKRGDQTPAVATFIYVDANHAEEAAGGLNPVEKKYFAIESGSTYMDDPGRHIQVRSAVDKFAARQQLQVITTTDDMPASWFIVKP
ncbi:hypothetical protein AK812_SmicGene27470 [Symbiodinium microadriaticum]|uniref:Uncharacterized protein n=1 Tax=Symbiodinium microadriaticum TaxID=2951 RepID=A0A1Q9D6R9_SYMMI|nr:hypothetical protein AK812_SmicGene27470 [Symbiodinium microadriaticum]